MMYGVAWKYILYRDQLENIISSLQYLYPDNFFNTLMVELTMQSLPAYIGKAECNQRLDNFKRLGHHLSHKIFQNDEQSMTRELYRHFLPN